MLRKHFKIPIGLISEPPKPYDHHFIPFITRRVVDIAYLCGSKVWKLTKPTPLGFVRFHNINYYNYSCKTTTNNPNRGFVVVFFMPI